MKYILVFFTFCNVLNAQQLGSLNAAGPNSNSILIQKATNTIFKQPTFNYDFIKNNASVISVFDRASGLNTKYAVGKDHLEFVNKTYIYGNDIMRADSFDPNGAGSLGPGVFIGGLNMLIDEIFPNAKNGSITLYKNR